MTIVKDQQHLARKADQLEREADRQARIEAEAKAVAGAPEKNARIQTDGGESDLPRCPRCGEPVKAMSVSGPSEAYLMPCGHTVPPDSVRNDEDGR